MSRLPLKKHCSVYFAGRVSEGYGMPDLWRQSFGVQQDDDGTVSPHVFGTKYGHESVYCGPSISRTHSDVLMHEAGVLSKPHNQQMDVWDQCVSDIRNADIVVARLDTGAYGSMWECGYAEALGKKVVSLVCDRELWFAAPGIMMGPYSLPELHESWKSYVNKMLRVNYHLSSWFFDACESPLESAVCQELHNSCWHLSDFVLSLRPQFCIKGYRLDLACLAKKVAFEFDGYSYHSSREQFNRDRERDRALSDLGWKTVRFHGDEIRQSPARIVDAIRKECCDSYRADCGLPVLEGKGEEAVQCIA